VAKEASRAGSPFVRGPTPAVRLGAGRVIKLLEKRRVVFLQIAKFARARFGVSGERGV